MDVFMYLSISHSSYSLLSLRPLSPYGQEPKIISTLWELPKERATEIL